MPFFADLTPARSWCSACSRYVDLDNHKNCISRYQYEPYNPSSVFQSAVDPLTWTTHSCGYRYLPAKGCQHCQSVKAGEIARKEDAENRRWVEEQEREREERKKREHQEWREVNRKASERTVENIEKWIYEEEWWHNRRLESRTQAYTQKEQEERFKKIQELKAELEQLKSKEASSNHEHK